MTAKIFTIEDFQKWGKQGGSTHKKTKPKDYFSKISKMRKHPGRKKHDIPLQKGM